MENLRNCLLHICAIHIICYFVNIVAIWTYLKFETIVTLQLELKNWSRSKKAKEWKNQFFSKLQLLNFALQFQYFLKFISALYRKMKTQAYEYHSFM